MHICVYKCLYIYIYIDIYVYKCAYIYVINCTLNIHINVVYMYI